MRVPAMAADDGKGTGGGIPPGGEPPGDNALLAQVAQGSEEALVALHRRYVHLVFSVTLHILRDPMAAEEVLQDVFIRLWRHPRAYNPDRGRLSSWLLTVARHAAIDRLRQDGRQPSSLSNPRKKDPHPAPEQTVPTADPPPELRHDLRMALGHLPLDQRTVIELAYFGGMSQQEVSDHLRLPLGTVKTRMRLGMQRLRGMWQQTAEPKIQIDTLQRFS